MVRSDPSNSSAKFSQAIATYKVSYSLAEIDPNAAVAMARESVRMFDAMKASHPSYLVLSRRAIALQRLAEAEFKAGHTADASRSSGSAIAAERSLPAQASQDMEGQMQFVEVLILAGKINTKAGKLDQAAKLFREAQDQAAPIAANPELTRIIPLAHSEEALGDFYVSRGQSAEARACYQKLAELWQRFAGSNEFVDRQRASAAKLIASLTY
jgi:tetratricopeptide (TPR) repeat protein